MIGLESVHHDGSPRYVRLPAAGEPSLGDEVAIRLRAHPAAPIERILLRTEPDGEQQFAEMQPEAGQGRDDEVCRWWHAAIKLTQPVTRYRFLIFGEQGAWWYNASGLHRHTPTDAEDYALLAGYAAPGWVREAVFYQIFPDRFADGDPSTNPRDGEWAYRGVPIRARRWGEDPTGAGIEQVLEFFGGDLAGIESKLDYLLELGVNALYLNPVFSAYSNHRYDVVDYEHVDPHLGGNAALVSLRRATAARGMRLILDIVPNHCGVGHPWFQAALADAAAPIAKYFSFSKHPTEYASWLGVSALPKLNYRSASLRREMYGGAESVFRRWLRPPYSIDGWRIDVANMLGRLGADQQGLEVAREIRLAVKEENPEAFLLGEHFFDASSQLQGDCWDAVMNYAGFAMPVWYWLGRFHVTQHGTPGMVASMVPWPTEALANTWQAQRAAIPWALARQQFNLLGSHDTTRILTHCAADTACNRLAVGMQMTYLGVPSVYYGDEVGMAGEGAAVRACMSWDRETWDNELLEFYRQLIGLRRSSKALTEGGFQVLKLEADTFAYLRDTDDEQLVIVCHRGPGVRPAGPLNVAAGGIPDGSECVEFFSGVRARVSGGNLPLPAMFTGIGIWRRSA